MDLLIVQIYLTFDIIELDRAKRRIIGSRKAIIAKEENAKKGDKRNLIVMG